MPHSYGDSLATVGFFLGASMAELTRENTVKRKPSNAKMRIGRYWSTGAFLPCDPFPGHILGGPLRWDGRSPAPAYDAGVTPRAASSRAKAPPPTKVYDVVVVGGGPSGSSCAYWLADAGWDVAVVEKKHFPREKTCGDGLTPRAVRQLADMGLEEALAGSHKYSGLRAYGFGQFIEMQWPAHPNFPSYGYTITRHDLDGLVAEGAVKAGATLFAGTEVIAPLVDEAAPPSSSDLPQLRGVTVKDKETGATSEIHARYVVVADGANSRVGRMLGTNRRRDLPLGMALRGYYTSDRHDDPFIESHLDIRDAEGNIVPGYGWIFPMGDGRVNVGVGLLSTDRRWKGVNTSHLMDAFVEFAPEVMGLCAPRPVSVRRPAASSPWASRSGPGPAPT